MATATSTIDKPTDVHTPFGHQVKRNVQRIQAAWSQSERRYRATLGNARREQLLHLLGLLPGRLSR